MSITSHEAAGATVKWCGAARPEPACNLSENSQRFQTTKVTVLESVCRSIVLLLRQLPVHRVISGTPIYFQQPLRPATRLLRCRLKNKTNHNRAVFLTTTGLYLLTRSSRQVRPKGAGPQLFSAQIKIPALFACQPGEGIMRVSTISRVSPLDFITCFRADMS